MFQLRALCGFDCGMSVNLIVTREGGGWVPKEAPLCLKTFPAEI